MPSTKQIIAFINPDTFASLLSYETPTGYFQNDTNLDNSNHLVYVEIDGTCDVGAYDETKANAASIILVPDSFNFQYTPDMPFKVLWHNQTDETLRVERFRNTTSFQGDTKSMEEPKTPYQNIAYLIIKEKDITFDAIWKAIKDVDILLRAKYDFIEQLADTTKAMPPLPSVLSNIIGDYKPSSNTNREKVYNEMLQLLFGE
jgi:hypothetical protein